MEDNNLEKEENLEKKEVEEKVENQEAESNSIEEQKEEPKKDEVKETDQEQTSNDAEEQNQETDVDEKKESKFNKKEICISCVIGILIGAILIYLLGAIGIVEINKKVIAKTNAGQVTEKMIYDEMIKHFSVESILELVDQEILDRKYTLTEEQEKEIDEQVEEVLNLYNLYYGYTEEQFLSTNGFESKEDFRDYMAFDYKRNLAFIDYVGELKSEEEVKNYYDENVYGEIDSKHMLVKITDDVKDKDAKKLAEEIIKKLDKGEDFDKVAEEYGDKITFEKLGYNGFDSGLVEEYVNASKELENGKYSKEPVKTSFGYHVIYKIDQKDKPSLEEAKNKILTVFGTELEKTDSNIRYKALIKLRKDNGLEFKDDKYKTDYEEYCKNYEV